MGCIFFHYFNFDRERKNRWSHLCILDLSADYNPDPAPSYKKTGFGTDQNTRIRSDPDPQHFKPGSY